jgi:hypothetical protein
LFKKFLFPTIAFVVVFLAHVAKYFWQMTQRGDPAWLATYFNQQIIFVSFAWALVGAFLVYALARFFEEHHFGLLSFLGSLGLTAFLWLIGAFLLGFYTHSPLRSFYLSLFGASYDKLTKPLLATVTILSVALGTFWIERKCETVCSECQIE